MGPTGGWTVERSVVEEVRFERYEDFRRWVADRPGYWILVRGIPIPSPSPSRKHQAVSLRFQLLLVDAVLRPGLGEVYDAPFDVKLREDTVYQPDLLVVLREHADRLRETHVEGAPDLIVEVLSPSTAHLDLVAEAVRLRPCRGPRVLDRRPGHAAGGALRAGEGAPGAGRNGAGPGTSPEPPAPRPGSRPGGALPGLLSQLPYLHVPRPAQGPDPTDHPLELLRRHPSQDPQLLLLLAVPSQALSDHLVVPGLLRLLAIKSRTSFTEGPLRAGPES